MTADDWSSVYGQHVGNKLQSYDWKTSAIVQHNIFNSLLFSSVTETFKIPKTHSMSMRNQTPSFASPPAVHQVEKCFKDVNFF